MWRAVLFLRCSQMVAWLGMACSAEQSGESHGTTPVREKMVRGKGLTHTMRLIHVIRGKGL